MLTYEATFAAFHYTQTSLKKLHESCELPSQITRLHFFLIENELKQSKFRALLPLYSALLTRNIPINAFKYPPCLQLVQSDARP